MNIVILTIILPYPLNSGGAQAQYNMIDRLRLNHRITLIFPQNRMNSLDAMKELQRRWPEVTFRPYKFFRQLLYLPYLKDKVERMFKIYCMSGNERFQVERLLRPYGYPMHRDFVKFVHKVLEEQKADVMQVEFFPYLHFVHKLPDTVKKVFVHHEIRYVRNRRLLSQLHLTASEKISEEQVKRQELADLDCFDRIVTLTEVDKKILSDAGVKKPIFVSPAAINAPLKEYKGWNGKITFLGGFGHTPNQEGMEWFLDNVVPLIKWEQWPQAEIQIVGGGWPKQYEQRAKSVKVTCCGFVEDLAQVAEGSIMIVPILSGSGMRMKILEAAAMGLPMLTTTVGVEGLDFVNGESCMVADSPALYAESLVRLMQSEEERRKLTTAARNLFIEKYSVEALARLRDEVYRF